MRAGTQHDIHRAHAGNSVRQAVVDAGDHSRAATFQSRQGEVPKRPLPVEALAHDGGSQFLQFFLRAVFQRDLAHVFFDVKLGVEFPARKTKIKGDDTTR